MISAEKSLSFHIDGYTYDEPIISYSHQGPLKYLIAYFCLLIPNGKNTEPRLGAGSERLLSDEHKSK